MSALTVISSFMCEHSPEILVGSGIVGFVATVILACKQTTKLEGIVKESEELQKKIEEFDPADYDTEEEYTEEDRERDLKILKAKTRLKVVRNYLLPGVIGIASIAAILCGFHIIRARYLLASSALASLEAAHRKYRERIRNKFGNQADEYGETGVWRELEEKVVKTTDDKGKEKTETVFEEKVTADGFGGPYFRLIGPGTYLWDKFHGDFKMIENQLAVSEAAYNKDYSDGKFVNFNEDVCKDLFAGKGKTDIGALSGRCRYDKESEARINQPFVDLGCFEYDENGRRHLKLIDTTTMEGENIKVPYINPNFGMVSFANISKTRDKFTQAERDKVKVRRGGKYISQGGM